MFTLMSIDDLNSRVEELWNGPLAKMLLTSLGTILFCMSAWALGEISDLKSIMVKIDTKQEYMDKEISSIYNDLRSNQMNIDIVAGAAATLKQRLDDLGERPRSDGPR